MYVMCYTALLGFATTVIPRWLTYYVSSALFAIFGLRMIREGLWHNITITIYNVFALYVTHKHCMLCLGMKMSADEGQEEYEEVQADIRKKDEEVCVLQPNRKTIEYVSVYSANRNVFVALGLQYDGQGEKDVETGVTRTPQRRLLYMFFSRVFIQSLTLTFLAEWGDRSQLATIILAAREVGYVVVSFSIELLLCNF
jgi:putative Ca2+/H+ antiporter (TMEM165/GDT1 family)